MKWLHLLCLFSLSQPPLLVTEFFFSLLTLKDDPETLLKCLLICHELLKMMALSKGIDPTINEIIESLVCSNKHCCNYNKNRCFTSQAGWFVIVSESFCYIFCTVTSAFEPFQNMQVQPRCELRIYTRTECSKELLKETDSPCNWVCCFKIF